MKLNLPYFLILLNINIQPIYGLLPIHGLRPFLYLLTILLTIYYFLSHRSEFSLIRRYKPFYIYSCLLIYHCINCYVQQVPLGEDTSGNYFYFFLQFFPNLCVLFLTYVTFIKDEKRTLKLLLYAFSFYMLLAFSQVTPEEGTGRLISSDIHPNMFAQLAGIGLMLGLLYNSFCLHSKLMTIAVWVLPVASILGCGSRNGLSLLFLAITAFFVSNIISTGINYKKVASFILALFCISFIIIYIINNTEVGQRMVDMQSKANEYEMHTGTILDILGEREVYYILGWYNFVSNPVFGIGLRNFAYYNNFIHPLHSEYMIHLCEGGFVGAILYCRFLWDISKGLFSRIRSGLRTKGCLIVFMFIAYLFVGVTGREMYYSYFFPLLAIVSAYSNSKNSKYDNI